MARGRVDSPGPDGRGRWDRSSRYIPVRDGTRLAADLYRPAGPGPHPVIWAHDRYRRAHREGGRLLTAVDRFSWLSAVLERGIAAAVVDVRGSGASFGTSVGPFSPAEARDAYDLTEWFAAQPWCDGKVGMFGRSYLGISQYLAAGTAPPHLRAIFPEMAMFDLYSFVYPGGVFRSDYVNWVRRVQAMDHDPDTAPAEDEEPGELRAAQACHRSNADPYDLFTRLPYRDSVDVRTGTRVYEAHNPAGWADGVRRSGVAVYHLGGWFDMWPKDAALWFANLRGAGPQRLVIGPWSHDQTHEFDRVGEHLGWFDGWLSGCGARPAPPVRYYLMGGGPRAGWRDAEDWPPAGVREQSWFLAPGRAGTVGSVNDGGLVRAAPTAGGASDRFTPSADATTGAATRWTNGYAGPFGYPDMTAYDRVGLTYTSPPLGRELTVVGHPVIHLWVRCPAGDGDFFVYLERVDPAGTSHYLTEGVLRASHRVCGPAPFDNLGLPFHPGLAAGVGPVPDEPVELVIDLHPTAVIMASGDRIRVAVRCADRDNYAAVIVPGSEVFVYRDAVRPSHLRLPVLAAERDDQDD